MSNIAKLKPFDKIEIIRKIIGITATQKLLLLIIASHLGKNSYCFVSLTTLEKETCLARTTIADNLRMMVNVDLIWKLDTNDKFKSNRYGINFEKLVALGYQCSSLGLLDQCPRATRVVASRYPKRNINKLKETKVESCVTQNEKNKKHLSEIRKKVKI